MTYTTPTPSTVNAGDTFAASSYNIISADIQDHESRLNTILNSVVPVGTIIPYVAATAPSNWLVCNGSQVSQSTYSALYAIIGPNKFGTDTGGNFYLPDLQGRMPVGLGTNADVDAIGENDGSALANRSPKHQHTIYDPTHTHFGAVCPTSDPADGGYGRMGNPGTIQYSQNMTSVSTGVKVNPQGAASSSNPTDTPAYIVLNFIIKY